MTPELPTKKESTSTEVIRRLKPLLGKEVLRFMYHGSLGRYYLGLSIRAAIESRNSTAIPSELFEKISTYYRSKQKNIKETPSYSTTLNLDKLIYASFISGCLSSEKTQILENLLNSTQIPDGTRSKYQKMIDKGCKIAVLKYSRVQVAQADHHNDTYLSFLKYNYPNAGGFYDYDTKTAYFFADILNIDPDAIVSLDHEFDHANAIVLKHGSFGTPLSELMIADESYKKFKSFASTISILTGFDLQKYIRNNLEHSSPVKLLSKIESRLGARLAMMFAIMDPSDLDTPFKKFGVLENSNSLNFEKIIFNVIFEQIGVEKVRDNLKKYLLKKYIPDLLNSYSTDAFLLEYPHYFEHTHNLSGLFPKILPNLLAEIADEELKKMIHLRSDRRSKYFMLPQDRARLLQENFMKMKRKRTKTWISGY